MKIKFWHKWHPKGYISIFLVERSLCHHSCIKSPSLATMALATCFWTILSWSLSPLVDAMLQEWGEKSDWLDCMSMGEMHAFLSSGGMGSGSPTLSPSWHDLTHIIKKKFHGLPPGSHRIAYYKNWWWGMACRNKLKVGIQVLEIYITCTTKSRVKHDNCHFMTSQTHQHME